MVFKLGVSYFIVLLLLRSNSSALSVSDCKSYGERPKNVGTMSPASTLERKVICSNMELRQVFPPGDIPNTTVTLILNNNEIQDLKNRSFVGLSALERLDIRNNLIGHIEPGAFTGLLALKRLDLSNNRLGCLRVDIFSGLPGLVRLNLSGNLFSSLPSGTFDKLTSLKSVEFQTPYLLCDCSMLWVLRWAKYKGVAIKDTRCSYPRVLRGRPLPSLQTELLSCDAPLELPSFHMTPSQRQIVFQGDSLPFKCLASYIEKDMRVLWFRDGKVVESNATEGIFIEKTVVQNCSFITSMLTISNVQLDSMGSWECLVSTRRGNSTRAVHIVVLERSAEHCPPEMVTNSKGVFRWPWTLAGITAYLPCSRLASDMVVYGGTPGDEHRAWRQCEQDGIWAQANYSHCQYVKDVTRMLFIINQMPLNLTNAVTTARQLLVYTVEAASFFEKIDVIFVTEMIEKFGKFAEKYKELGDVMVDISSNLMQVDEALLQLAQQEARACSRIVECLRRIPGHRLTSSTQSYSINSHNIAMEAHAVRASSFNGMTCTLFQKVAPNRGTPRELGGRDADRILDKQLSFKCNVTSSHSSVGLKNNVVEASIQLPASLFSSLPASGPDDGVHRLELLAFRNGRLFPSTHDPSDMRSVATPVILIQIDGRPPTALLNPVNTTLRRPNHGADATAVRWNASLKDGWGGWESAGCRLFRADANFSTVSCDSLGSYAVLMDLSERDDFASNAPLLHPVVYATAVIFLLCLLVIITTYVLHHRSVQVSRKTWHMLVNTCLHMFLTCAVYVGGITQTRHSSVCQVGIVLHYSSLATILWVGVTARSIYKQVSRKARISEELHEPPAPPRPMLRFYLIGSGIPVTICGITAAANMKNYGRQSDAPYCWMVQGPCLAAFHGPAGLAILVGGLYFLGVLVQLRYHPGRLYELKEVASEQSCVAGDPPDVPAMALENEHSFRAQLLGTFLTQLLFMGLWAAGALAVSLGSPLDLCFSCLFGVLALALGTFLLVHHCITRKDVRCLWTSTCCPSRWNNWLQADMRPVTPGLSGSSTGSSSTNRSTSSVGNSSQDCKLTNLKAEAVQCKPHLLPLLSEGASALLDCSLTEHSMDDEIQMHIAPVEPLSRFDWRSGRLQKSRTRAHRSGRLAVLRGYAYDVPTSVDGSDQKGPRGDRQTCRERFQSRSQGHLDSSDTSSPLPRRCRSMDWDWSSVEASGNSTNSVRDNIAVSVGAGMDNMEARLEASIVTVDNVGASIVSMGASMDSAASMANGLRISSCCSGGEEAGGGMASLYQKVKEGEQSRSHGLNLTNQDGLIMDNRKNIPLLIADNNGNIKTGLWKHETTV